MDYETQLAELRKIRGEAVSSVQVQVVLGCLSRINQEIEQFERDNKPPPRQPQVGDTVEILECSENHSDHKGKVGIIVQFFWSTRLNISLPKIDFNNDGDWDCIATKVRLIESERKSSDFPPGSVLSSEPDKSKGLSRDRINLKEYIYNTLRDANQDKVDLKIQANWLCQTVKVWLGSFILKEDCSTSTNLLIDYLKEKI